MSGPAQVCISGRAGSKGSVAGALGGTRTPNLLIRSQMLYPLSYERRENLAQCTAPPSSRAASRLAELGQHIWNRCIVSDTSVRSTEVLDPVALGEQLARPRSPTGWL